MRMERRWMAGGTRLAVACLALWLAACGGSGGDAPELRETAYGKLRGVDDSAASGTYFWKGVPFAQPPVGALRWQPPAEPVAWQGERDARQFGSACLQIGRIYGPGANNRFDDTIAATLGQPVGSEDCLTLNIWRPAGATEKLPVLLFVHGGSAISGYTADPVYDGAALARAANAVVVTANYRLDILGFMQLPQMQQAGAPATGNFALLDNIQALRFIQRNIARFGGDAGNVTLMGQSAGAINALALLTADQAKGLFHRIVPISGGLSLPSNLPAGTLSTIKPATAYAAQAAQLLGHLMVADGLAADLAAAATLAAGWSPAQVAGYLRGKDGRVLLQTLAAKGLTSAGPIPDGLLLPADPMAALAAGRYHKVPVMAGYTAEEGKLFAPLLAALGGRPGFRIDDAARFRMMQSFDPDAPSGLGVADIIDAAYLPVDAPGTGYNARMALLGRLFIDPSRDQLLNTLRSQQPDVWAYRFDWARQPAPWDTVYGAAHAFDLPFLFGNFGPSVFARASNSRANEGGRRALSGAMGASLKAFMQSGDPQNTALGQPWRPWPSSLVFDADLNAARIRSQ